MNRGILLKSLRELWPTTLFIGLALLVVEAFLAAALPTLERQLSAAILQMKFFQTLLQALLGADIGATLGPGMVASICWVHPVVLALVWAHAIIACTRIPAGEVDRATIDTLLSLPVARRSIFVSDSLACIAGAIAILVCALIGNTIGSLISAPDLRPPLPRVLMVLVNLFCVYLVVGACACLASSLTDRRGRAIAAVFLAVLVSFLINFLAGFWSPAKSVSFLSILDYHRPLFILRDGRWPLRDIAILSSVALTLWLAAGVVFARRDLSAL